MSETLHKLVFQETWERALSKKDRELFRELFHTSDKSSTGEINFINVRAGLNYEENLFATVLIQNGREEDMLFEDFPLIFEDAHEVVVESTFTIKELIVKPHSSTPWTFIFQKESLKKEQIDFSSWSVRTF